jgi:hypothetical protein
MGRHAARQTLTPSMHGRGIGSVQYCSPHSTGDQQRLLGCRLVWGPRLFRPSSLPGFARPSAGGGRGEWERGVRGRLGRRRHGSRNTGMAAGVKLRSREAVRHFPQGFTRDDSPGSAIRKGSWHETNWSPRLSIHTVVAERRAAASKAARARAKAVEAKSVAKKQRKKAAPRSKQKSP